MVEYMTIQEAAARLHVSESTIRRLEREGVLLPAARNHSGWRIYTDADLKQMHGVLYPAREPVPA
jgi:excisionase family DNA binding protein